jgi:hypothetical protein
MSYDHGNSIFTHVSEQPYVITVSFEELNKVLPWTLSADPKAGHLMVGHE